MRPVRLGLVGAANQGREHLAAAGACSQARITAACDLSAPVRDDTSARFPEVPMYAGLSEMLAAHALDGLVLALPHDAYDAQWHVLLQAGLPILKEKPLGRTLAEAARFVAHAQQAGVALVTAIQRRHHPSYVELEKLLHGTEIRELSATLHLGFDPTRRPAGWRGDPSRAGGGALLDAGYHLVDLVQYLLGAFEVVHANLWNGDRPATPDLLESEARVLGRAGRTWIRIDCQVGGTPDVERPGKRKKHERVVAVLGDGRRVEASRSQVLVDGACVFQADPSWTRSVALQLDAFARRITENRFDDLDVWSQVPAMRLIERAYAIARAVGPVPEGVSRDR